MDMDKENKKAYQKEYVSRNKEKITAYKRAYNKEWYRRKKAEIALLKETDPETYANSPKRYPDPEYAKTIVRDRRIQKRKKVIEHYGGRCSCCGENRYEFLAIDHINGNGNRHKMQVGDVMSWVWSHGFPDGFRILCHNCNLALGFYGYCPHGNEIIRPKRGRNWTPT